MAGIQLGYFEQWRNKHPLILFAGNQEAAHKLELIFGDLAKGELNEVNFNNLCDVRAFHHIQLKASLSSENKGLLRKEGGPFFEWALSSKAWETYAELLSGFREEDSGHQYLHAYAQDHTEVMVSVNEYQDDWPGWQ